MGEKLGKNKERLQSKMAVYNKLLRQAERQNRRNGGSVNVASLQENARERAAKVQLRVDEGLALMNYQQPTKNSTAYARNLDAIDAIRAAIAEHPMQAHMPLSDISDQPKALQEMIAQVEIDLSLIALEEELLGHMAQLLALDAMALAEDVDADMAMADDRLVTNELSLSSQAFNLFTD